MDTPVPKKKPSRAEVDACYERLVEKSLRLGGLPQREWLWIYRVAKNRVRDPNNTPEQTKYWAKDGYAATVYQRIEGGVLPRI